jgi:hypothetical protein
MSGGGIDVMQLADSRFIPATPEKVWIALLDPQVLQACIPGCESMTGSPEAGYEAVLAQRAGPLSFRVTGVVTLTDIRPGRGASVSAAGKGGVAGVAAGGAKVALVPESGGTRLTYVVEANLGGKIAQLGGWIIEAFARRLADQFFARFETALAGPGDAQAVAAAPGQGWLGRLLHTSPKGGEG